MSFAYPDFKNKLWKQWGWGRPSNSSHSKEKQSESQEGGVDFWGCGISSGFCGNSLISFTTIESCLWALSFQAPAGMGIIFQRSAQTQTQGHHQEEEKEEIQSRNIGCELWNSFPLSWFKRPSCRCLTNSTTVLDFTSVTTFSLERVSVLHQDIPWR